jgi:hypothetical protein
MKPETRTMPRRLSTRLHVAVIACYALITALMLHAAIFNATTHGTGYDYYNFHWNFWWVRHALTTPGLRLYATDFVFYPHVTNLAYHTLALFWYPVWAALEPLVGTFVAMTILLVVGGTLSAYALFVWLRSEGAAVALAFLAGVVLQSSPIMRYFLVNTHINLMNWFWLPVHLLLFKHMAREAERGDWGRVAAWAVGMGWGLAGMVLSDLQFVIFLALVLLPYGALALWRVRAAPRVVAGIIGASLIAILVAVLLLGWIGLLPALAEFRGTLAPGRAEDRPGIPFPEGFVSMHPTWWEWNTPSMGAFVTVAVLITLTTALIVRHMLRAAGIQGRHWFWLAVMLPPLILALGPTLTLGGIEVPLPYRWLHALTSGNFRMPWRVAPVALMAAMVFVSLAWTPLLRRWRARRTASLALLLVLIALIVFAVFADTRLYASAPLWPIPTRYGFYEQIRAEPGLDQAGRAAPRLLIEVPTGVGSGEVILGPLRALQLQLHGIDHGQKMINGFVARAPIEHIWGFNTDDPLISWLGQRQPLREDRVGQQLSRLVQSGELGYIVVHQNLIDPNDPALQDILGYFNRVPHLLCPAYLEGAAVAYRAATHPQGCPPRTPPRLETRYVIDVGSPADRRYIGGDWHRPEQLFESDGRWAGHQPTATLYLDLSPGAYRLEFAAQAFHFPREIGVRLNQTPLAHVQIAPDGVQRYALDIPAALLGSGQHTTLTFELPGAQTAAELGLSADRRPLSIWVDWVAFAPVE